MLIHAAKPLFAWSELEDVPQLLSIKEILGSLPDEALLDGLRAARGNGRDDYPVSVLWGVVLLSILCRHPHFEDCLDELQRNPTLCALIGIHSPTTSKSKSLSPSISAHRASVIIPNLRSPGAYSAVTSLKCPLPSLSST